MKRATYPHPLRLRTRADFRRVMNEGLIHPGGECLVRTVPNGLEHPRLGIAAPRRFGKAIRRNRFRRLVREAFRSLQSELSGLDVMVSPRKQLGDPTLAGVCADLRAAPSRARKQDLGRRRPNRRAGKGRS